MKLIKFPVLIKHPPQIHTDPLFVSTYINPEQVVAITPARLDPGGEYETTILDISDTWTAIQMSDGDTHMVPWGIEEVAVMLTQEVQASFDHACIADTQGYPNYPPKSEVKPDLSDVVRELFGSMG